MRALVTVDGAQEDDVVDYNRTELWAATSKVIVRKAVNPKAVPLHIEASWLAPVPGDGRNAVGMWARPRRGLQIPDLESVADTQGSDQQGHQQPRATGCGASDAQPNVRS